MSAISGLRGVHVRFLNRFARHVIPWLPGFAAIEYVGRTSGRRYRIPIKYFQHGPDYVFALMYGADVQWVKNVEAAGGCDLKVRRGTTHLVDPHLVVDPTRRLLPRYVRGFFGAFRVNEFVTMRPLTDPS